MIMDKELLFSSAQDLAQTNATYNSTNVIDLGVADTPVVGTVLKDLGRGRLPIVFAVVTEAFSTGSSPTIKVQVVNADSSDLNTNPVIVMTSQAIAAATAVAGYVFRLGGLLLGVTKRYLGLQYVIGTAATTTGKITAGLVWGVQLDYSVQ